MSYMNLPNRWNESDRLRRVQTPVIPVIAALIRENPGTISLGQGVVSYGPPPEAIAQISQFLQDPENHKYKPVQGLPQLVEVLQRKLSTENGIDVAGRRIFVTAGGNLAFTNALLAIADPGDEVILQVPYYFNHEMAVTMASCRPVLVPTDAKYQLRPDLIAQAITPKTKAVVTISPNNPSGAVYPESALRAVNELCRVHGLYHIHDEAYEYFTYGSARHFSPASIADSADHTISLFSLSKAYGFASWRIGYMVVPEHLISAVNKIQDTILICAPVISQYAAIGALTAGRAYCREKLSSLNEIRDQVLLKLQTISDLCEVPPADGAFYFLLRVKSDFDPVVLAQRLVREHKVAVIPGNAFGFEHGCYLRVSYGALTLANAEEGVARLVTGIKTILVR